MRAELQSLTLFLKNGHFTFMSHAVEVCEELQLKIAKLSRENMAENAKHVDDVVKSQKKGLFYFNKAFFSIVPARYLDFPVFAEFIMEIQSLKEATNRKAFVDFLLTRLKEPNQCELCEFSTHLVETKFLSPVEYLTLLDAALEKSSGNINFIQVIYGIVRIGKLLQAESPKELARIMDKMTARVQGFERDECYDYNADLLTILFQSVLELQKKGWDIPEDYPNRQLLRCFMTDDSAKLEELCKGGLDISSPLDATLLTPCSMLSFGAPLTCAAAFHGALKCLKVLVGHGADLSSADDEERIITHFAAASGNIEVLAYLKEQSQSFVLAPSAAVEYWRYDAFDWLHKNVFPTLKGIEPEGKETMLHAAAKVNNIHIAKVLKQAEVSALATDDVLF